MSTQPSDAGLDELVRRFDGCTLPKAEWTHAAHLKVGLWYVSRHGQTEALVRLRSGITRLNESHGTRNTATTGYHETITRAYTVLLAEFSARHATLSVGERARALLTTPLAAKDVLLRFYSRARLESVEARLGWAEPDLAPLALDAALASVRGFAAGEPAPNEAT